VARTAVVLVLALAVLVATASEASALSCPNVPVTERLDEVDGAFIGVLVSERKVDDGYLYRFDVKTALKGADGIGSAIDLRAPSRLVSRSDELLAGFDDVEVGVMFTTDRAMPETESCLLSPPLDLISAFDEPRGNAIKVVIGVIILIGVLLFATVRLKRKQRQQELQAPEA